MKATVKGIDSPERAHTIFDDPANKKGQDRLLITVCKTTRTERCGVVGTFEFRAFRAFGEATIVN